MGEIRKDVISLLATAYGRHNNNILNFSTLHPAKNNRPYFSSNSIVGVAKGRNTYTPARMINIRINSQRDYE